VHFASRLTCPTLIGVGLSDPIVPPETVIAIASQLRCRHIIRQFPESHGDRDKALWEPFQAEVLALSKQIPEDFGNA
jgi:cephalosporin-C deacetylase-like acetyl esterase